MDIPNGIRLTIWRQFSANHSSGFTIVGEFETAVQAQEAATEIAQILATVSDWHGQNGSLPMDMRSEPVPIELEIGEKYGVDWKMHHNWIMPQSNLERAVVVIDNHVVMETTALTLARPQPFDEIMGKLGGDVRFDAEPYFTPLVVNLQCIAPDFDAANNLRKLLKTRLNDKYAVVPWLTYGVASHHTDTEKLFEDAEISLTYEKAYHQERDQLLDVVNHAVDADEKECELQRLYQFEAQNRKHWPVDSAVHTHWRLCVYQVRGISSVGRELQIEHLWFRSIVSGLPATLAWLKDQGCSEIRYEIIQLDNRPK